MIRRFAFLLPLALLLPLDACGRHAAAKRDDLTEAPDVGIASADLQKAEADRIAAEHDLERQKELLAAHATSSSRNRCVSRSQELGITWVHSTVDG